MKTRCFAYLRTSGDDGKHKAGIDVQRTAVVALSDFQIEREFVDDGVTGKIPMHARPAGKQLIAALLADGVKHVLCYDGKRIGRTQPAFWSFIGLCRDNGITVLDKDRVNLCESVQGGINGLMAEMDRNATVERLARGKAHHAALGRRVNGRWPYGEHPDHRYDSERTVVAKIRKFSGTLSLHAIAKVLNSDGITTRYGKQFTAAGIRNILSRGS